MIEDEDVGTLLEGAAVVEVSADELEGLLAAGRLAREVDTRLSGPIRVLTVGDAVLFQEQTPRGLLLVRRLPTLTDADRLIDDRLATYERMWDGCGCKVDYYRTD